VVPYGFDLSQLVRTHPLTQTLRRQHPGIVILAVGRHVSYKGFDVLIRAMPAVDPAARLVIVGTGPLTEAWQSLVAALGLQDRVFFAGLVTDEDLPAYYQACDLLCLPSLTRAEAFGIVQIEAMACGKPVVSTRLGTGVDFVNIDDATGFTVEPGNPQELSGALNRIVRNPELRLRLGEAARQRAETEFSPQTMAERTLALYREATEARRPPRHPHSQLDSPLSSKPS
jgi:rhamnosyl/mannosyltransferase